MRLTFEWDEGKARENLRKHKVSFEEAKTVFGDAFLVTFPDLEHSESEERYVSVGISSKGRVLVVTHTERGRNVRVINARKATASERKVYEEGGL